MIKYYARKRKSPQSDTELYYPTVSNVIPQTIGQVNRFIEKYCTLSDADISAALLALEDVMVDLLQSGRSIRLGDLGSFRPTIASASTQEEADKVSADDVRGLRCRFTPSASLRNALKKKNLSFQKV